jgi:TonB family protein
MTRLLLLLALLPACARATSGGAPTLPSAAPADTTVYLERDVDQPVTPIDLPKPELMSEERDCPRVDIRYIVGPDGKAERWSIEVIRTNNAEFSRAVVKAIRQARFRPAILKGQPVRQRVEQQVTATYAGCFVTT